MYPNPQDALPLPLRPTLDQYQNLVTELVAACHSDDPSAIRTWSRQWVDSLAAAADSGRLA